MRVRRKISCHRSRKDLNQAQKKDPLRKCETSLFQNIRSGWLCQLNSKSQQVPKDLSLFQSPAFEQWFNGGFLTAEFLVNIHSFA
jgi:hypothetical protein